MPHRLNDFVSLLVLVCIGLLAGCAPLPTSTPAQTSIPVATPGPVISAPSDPSPPITVKMILAKVPRLNEVVELDLVINSIADAPATTVSYDFTDGVVFESGSLDWKGDLKTKDGLTLKTTIKITKEGQITLKGKALATQSNGDVWADAAYIYLTVTKDAGFVGFATPENPSTGKQQVVTPPATNP
jgi:hypothetical protein